MFSPSTLAVFGLVTIASSHMIMNTPVPYGKSTLNNSPLAADGSDFPCKQRTGVYDAEGASNTMALGSSQSLAFTGSATHGGGSCQVSVTYDDAPTTSSTWKVIHSIEGGCPIKNTAGNNGDSADAVDPDTYTFTVPTSLPTGNATLAWTWFNKVGNREMYMNCAPITLTAASSKRSEEIDQYDEYANSTMLMGRDTAAFDALPSMLVANIGNGCTSVDSADLKFPTAGDSLELDGASTATPTLPTGTGCPAAGASGASGTAGASATATSAAVATSKPTSAAGGVFATVPASSAASVATSAPVAASSVASAAPVASSIASSAAPASSASTGTTGTGTQQTVGSACTTEGEWNCIGGTSYQQCASGAWSAVMTVASGTTCSSGESMSINITSSGSKRRSVRFSNDHIRRHQQHHS